MNELPETLDKEKLAKAVDELFEKYPAGVASVYLQMFQLQTEDGWDELAEVLGERPPRHHSLTFIILAPVKEYWSRSGKGAALLILYWTVSQYTAIHGSTP